MENYTGKRLDGRYEMQEIVGVGGMAVVYKAYDNIDDRTVAVKVLKDEFIANEEFRRRFKNESKAIAVLSHPNIVKVYDVSYGDKLQYIVMEYVEGITLKEYIQQQGVINTKEAVFFVMQILRALQHAHDKGIVHRDIKPQNIMLLENGAIKVTDFGIARFSASETRTMTDSTIGSVHYISPEQARGDITDDKADIYSVGVMLYEMLTGKLPFESDNTVSVAIMQLQQDPVMPREINPEIPVGLEQIIIRAMQKNVNDRYQSAAEMLLDLDEFKRNTSVRFDYDYSNNEPTKYIPTVTNTVESAVNTDDDDDDDEPVVKNRTIPILIGIIVALAVVLGSGFFLLYHFGYFSNDGKEKVPNLVGKIYSEESFASDYSSFAFEVVEKLDADETPNEILEQEPAAGEKINPKTTKIKITIATSSEMVTIPEKLVGYDYVTVVTALTQAGFSIREKPVDAADYSGDLEAGTVIKVTPSEGTKVSVNSAVTVEYITYDENKDELVMCPDVSNLSEADAKKVLTASGFTVLTNYEYSSSIKKGYVISNTLSGTKVPKGSSVTIIISRGELVEQTATVYVTLPDTGDYVSTSATLDGVNIISSSLNLDGSTHTVYATGSEPTSVFKFFVEGKLIYKCNINFTTSPCTISNISTYEYEEPTTEDESLITVPNVVNETYDEAVRILKEAGFTGSITHLGPTTGYVAVQIPPQYSKTSADTQITLTLIEPPTVTQTDENNGDNN